MMAVDSLRETRHINRISPRDIGVLWSAQSYRPDITAAIRKIRSMAWRPLVDLCVNPIGPGPHPSFVPVGHPCLKTKNVLGTLVDTNEVDFVGLDDVRRWPHYLIEREDLVLNITGSGSIGRIGIYFGNDRPLTNQHLAKLSIRPGTDAAFVCSFLTSWWGERLLEQGISGSTGQLNLVNEHIRQVPILEPNLQAQRYIGDKVRQAERFHERARRLRHQLDRMLSIPALVDALSTTEMRTNRVSASDLNPRLDSKYYGSRAMAVLQAAGENGDSIGSFVEEVSNGFEHRHFDYEGTPYITVTEVSGGRLEIATAPRLGTSVSVPKKACLDTRCVLVVRTGSIGVAVPVFEEDTHAAISSHIVRLRFGSEEEAAVVAAFLNSEAGRVLQKKISYGAVQPQIGQDELLALPIPKTLLNSGEWILSTLKTEDVLLRSAQRLTAAATSLVEHLIEGRITEADLVAAQTALDAGDRSADREILKALRHSDAPGAQPLFADVDGLYALLDDSEGQDP